MENKKYLADEFEEDNSDNEKMTSKPHYLNNQSNELFDEDSAVIHPLLNVRRVSLPQDGENWEVLLDKRVVFTLLGIKLTKKERTFLRSPEGFRLLMDEYKSGNKTVSGIRKKIKELQN